VTAVADTILEEYWQLHPVEATHAGVHVHDFDTADLSEEGWEARRAWRRRSERALQSAPDVDILDREVLVGEFSRQQVMDEVWRLPLRAPMLYLDEALSGVQYLLARSGDAEAVASRVAAIPRLLEQGRAQLRGDLVPPEFVEIALVGCAGAQRFLAELDATVALRAVGDYEAFLRNDLKPRGTFALGRDGFERLLASQGIPLSADEVHAHGRQLADELLGKLGADWRAEVEALKSDHPTRDALLQTYANEALRARRFVEQHALVEVPAGERFEVRPTAPFLRATMPLGHFDKAPPFADSDNLGVLYITPIDPSLPHARQEELLQAHCFTAIRAICLHETFPGHHVQLWHAKLRGTPIRRQFPSAVFTEGWGLYCEELMEEAGYYDSPGLSLWRLKNAMWRAVRLMVDVGLHCLGLSVSDASLPLVSLGGLEPNTARGEALRYTTSPTQPSSYVLGRDRIFALRQRFGRTRAEFHDWLLGMSSVSPYFLDLA